MLFSMLLANLSKQLHTNHDLLTSLWKCIILFKMEDCLVQVKLLYQEALYRFYLTEK